MKDEIEEGYMTEFVALSSKVYAFKESCLDNSLIKHKKVKGKNVTKKSLCFDMFKLQLYTTQDKKQSIVNRYFGN